MGTRVEATSRALTSLEPSPAGAEITARRQGHHHDARLEQCISYLLTHSLTRQLVLGNKHV